MPTRQRHDSAGAVQSLPSAAFPLSSPGPGATSRAGRDNAARVSSPKVSMTQALKDTFHSSWYLGLTSFGGPPVHFQIVR